MDFDQLKDKIKGILAIKTLNSSLWGLKILMDYGYVQQVLLQHFFFFNEGQSARVFQTVSIKRIISYTKTMYIPKKSKIHRYILIDLLKHGK